MDELQAFMERLGISPDDALKALIGAFSPVQPPALRQGWRASKRYGNSAPTTKEIWAMFEAADFRCTSCGSQRRITLDHKNNDPTDHSLENLEVLCSECNRGRNAKATRDTDHQLRVYRATLELLESLKRFPTYKEIQEYAGLEQIGGATYLVKYLKARLG